MKVFVTLKIITLISLLTIFAGSAVAEEPAIKCSYGHCNVENGLTDDMVQEIKGKNAESANASLRLKNVSNDDLKKLPELKDVVENLEITKCSGITDLTPLSTLVKLERLVLDELEQLSNLTPLSSLQQLESLTLDTLEHVSDLTPVGKLGGLKSLFLHSLKAEPLDFSPVGNLKQLQELFISYGHYTQVDFLKPLNKLQRLTFTFPPKEISDVSALQGKTELKELSLGFPGVKDISALKDSTQLEKLDIFETQVEDLSVLKELKKLKELSIVGVPAKDLSPVGELTELRIIDLDYTNFIDYSPLANCTKLEKISAMEASFDDLRILQSLPELKKLVLSKNTKIEKWDALASVTSLEGLFVAWTSFKDLGLLTKMAKLQSLNIRGCTVTNSEAIVKLPEFHYLDATDAKGIKDISIFKDLPKIAKFRVISKKEQFPQEQLDILDKAKEEAKNKE